LQRTNDRLIIKPCLPSSWNSFSMRYRFGATFYQINVERSAPVADSNSSPDTSYILDGQLLTFERAAEGILLIDDMREHVVGVRINF